MFKQFTQAFTDADIVLFMDIYASARETVDTSVSSSALSDKTKKYKSNVYHSGSHKKTLKWIKKHVRKGDVVLTMGAGDIFHLYKKLFKEK
ncbi:hypothetical protein KKB40_01765 [Patescibacteria group bacterium]|nr:hypothetical protein [Patescibacteria group bacterium]